MSARQRTATASDGPDRARPVRGRRQPLALALTLVALVVAAACGSEGSAGAPAAVPEAVTAEERAYLEAVESAERIRAGVIRKAYRRLEQSYAVPSRFVQVMREAQLPAALAASLRAVERLEPPARLLEAHEERLRVLRAELEGAREMSEALRRGDLLIAVLALAEVGHSLGTDAAGWSELLRVLAAAI